MKRAIIVTLLFIFCVLSMVACKNRSNWKDEFVLESDNIDEEPIQEYSESLQDNTVYSKKYQPTWLDMDSSDIPYQYANMFESVSATSVIDTPKELFLICSYPGRLVLMEYKKDSGQIEPFCKLATCSHNTEECVAGNALSLDYRDGILSMTRLRGHDTWISKLSNGRFEFIAGPVNSFIQGDDGYYSITKDSSLVRFKFETNKPEILIDEFGYIKPVIIGDYLYAANVEDIVRVDLRGPNYSAETVVSDVLAHYSTDGESLYYLKMEKGEPALYRCDPEGNNQEMVINRVIYPAYLAYDNIYIYYSTTNLDDPEDPTNGNIYRLRKDLTEEPQLICETGARFPFVYVLPTSPDTLLVHMNKMYYFLPKAGGELTELVLP